MVPFSVVHIMYTQYIRDNLTTPDGKLRLLYIIYISPCGCSTTSEYNNRVFIVAFRSMYKKRKNDIHEYVPICITFPSKSLQHD